MSKKVLQQQSQQYKADSTATKIEYREVVKDSLVMVPADSAMVRALLECDSLGQVRLKQLQTINGLRLMQNFSLKGNLLIVGAKIDSLAVYLAYKSTYELKQSNAKQTETSSSQESKKVVVGTPWYWIVLKWLGVVVGVFLSALYIYSKFSISSFFK